MTRHRTSFAWREGSLELTLQIPLPARYRDLTYSQGAACHTPDLLPFVGPIGGINALYMLGGENEARRDARARARVERSRQRLPEQSRSSISPDIAPTGSATAAARSAKLIGCLRSSRGRGCPDLRRPP